jgi:hypothetical protein
MAEPLPEIVPKGPALTSGLGRRCLIALALIAVLTGWFLEYSEKGRIAAAVESPGASPGKDIDWSENGSGRKVVRKRPLSDATAEFLNNYRSTLSSDAVLRDKTNRLRSIARRYVREVGIEEAIRHLGDFSASGNDRRELNSYFFEYAEEAQGLLLSLARQNDDPRVRQYGLGGVFRNMSTHGVEPEALEGALPRSPDENAEFNDFVIDLLGRGPEASREPFGVEKTVDLMRRAYPDTEAHAADIRLLLQNAADEDPASVLNYCKSSNQESADLKQEILVRCLGTLIGTDASGGLAEVLQLRSTSPEVMSASACAEIFQRYIKSDRSEAVDWFELNQSAMDPEFREQAEALLGGRNQSPNR